MRDNGIVEDEERDEQGAGWMLCCGVNITRWWEDAGDVRQCLNNECSMNNNKQTNK